MSEEHEPSAELALPPGGLRDLPTGLDSNFLTRVSSAEPLLAEGVPVVAAHYALHRSGLVVPSNLARSPAPIERIAVFLTGRAAFGRPIGAATTLDHLQRVPFETALQVCAHFLHRLDAEGQDRADRQFLDFLQLVPGPRRRVETLLAGRTVAVAPQIPLALIKLAARVSGDALLPGVDEGNVAIAWLGLADDLQRLAGREDPSDSLTVGVELPIRLVREIVATHHFHAQHDLQHIIGKFMRRWTELPLERPDDPRMVDLAAVFEHATQVALRDFILIGVTLYTACLNGRTRIERAYLADLPLATEVVDRVLDMVASPVAELRGWSADDPEPIGWEFDHLERYPLIRLGNGDLIMVRPRLVLQRFFGWLPAYDVEQGLRDQHSPKKTITRFQTCLAHLAEIYALESVTAQARRHGWRFFDGDRLAEVYAPRGEQRTCDGAIHDGRRWALLELTTSRLTRPSITAASAEHLDADLDKLLGKVEQLDQTIAALRNCEALLTGQEPAGNRRYLPALVTTEGWPINPATLTILRQRAAARGMLVGHDVAPLEVLDNAELEILEGAHPGELTLLDALAQKSSGGLALTSMRDYLLAECQFQATVSDRVDRLWQKAFDIAIDAMSGREGDA